MAWFGLLLLALVALGIISTGLPAVVVLIAVASLGATLGVLTGAVPLSLLSALPGRLINLLENDLLQALPLYVPMGLLLDRLPVADALYRTSLALLPRGPSAPLVSGMVLGALLGPMNGSVGASVLALSRVVAPRLAARLPAPTRAARSRSPARSACHPAVARADPARRRDAGRAHHRGHRDRAQRPGDQHPGRLPRRAGARRDLSGDLPARSPGCAGRSARRRRAPRRR